MSGRPFGSERGHQRMSLRSSTASRERGPRSRNGLHRRY
jgi:hypothetical protein